jgi:D-tagatose-1,6-bisphosphate aldolase subunit GatZ/KbaZ
MNSDVIKMRRRKDIMKNQLLNMIEKRQAGIHVGIPSFCCANKMVIEAILDQSKRFDDTVLIEGTSNQVNQFGGYTGMSPMDFTKYTYTIADRIGFDRNKIIFGGDHMGPLPWCELPAAEAMEHAKLLVKLCVEAGYKKIHLDTSMRLGDDPVNEPLKDELVAERGAILFEECEKAYQKLLKSNPDEVRPVYVIGSEVPIPGGSQEVEDHVAVTKAEDFENTLLAYKKEFKQRGMAELWKYVIAIVVQPGVEFGERGIHAYDRVEAAKLCKALKQYPDIVFEGHSTDYQAPIKLREMVEDGIAIIKVGPALTYALREGVFALSKMEKELILDYGKQSHFEEVIDAVMIENPKNWIKHYHGSEDEIRLDRKYSFFDRCRYYFVDTRVDSEMEKLFDNMDKLSIPLGLLHQYMPRQYARVRDGKLQLKARELVKDCIVELVEDYNYAVKTNYMINGIF